MRLCGQSRVVVLERASASAWRSLSCAAAHAPWPYFSAFQTSGPKEALRGRQRERECARRLAQAAAGEAVERCSAAGSALA